MGVAPPPPSRVWEALRTTFTRTIKLNPLKWLLGSNLSQLIISSCHGRCSKGKGREFRCETAREGEGRRGTCSPSSFLARPQVLLTHLKHFFPSLSNASHTRGGGGRGELLPYMGYIGTCRGIGYGFWGSRSLNRVSFWTLLFLCPWCSP